MSDKEKQKEYWHISRRFIPPEGEALKKAQELAESDRRVTVNEAMVILKNETGEFINIEQAVRNGEIPSYAPGSCKPLGVPEKNLNFVTDEEEVYADDLNKWLDNKPGLRVKFRFPTVKTSKTASAKSSGDVGDKDESPENWKMRVQEEAAKRWRNLRQSNCNPTPYSLKDELAKWCKEKNIFTKQGINPNPEYIYRHVINSRNWTPPRD